LAAVQRWRQRQCSGGSVSSVGWRRAAVRRQCSPSSSLMMNILCDAVVMGAGTTMFLIFPATNFLVDKNSVMCGLHTNIVSQYRYKGTNYLADNACGMRRNLRCSRYTAFFEQSIPVWNRLSYLTYIGIQYWQKIVLIRNQYILRTYVRT
jgi:hypothetical protein